ncbi:fungal-specific transcription factor domain-containing protein [Aspergillus insuetus]
MESLSKEAPAVTIPSLGRGENLPALSPPLEQSPPSSSLDWKRAFTLSDVLSYIETYRDRMYPVWPVIDVARLSTALQAGETDYETCALAFAVCAGTGAQLQLKTSNQHQLYNDMSDRFATESERYRLNYDYRESSTIEAILIPLFLHFYYGAKGKRLTASFLLREAISICQLLGLDKEETYRGFDPGEESYRRRIFWLLYVTERGHAMQHGTPVCLTKSIALSSFRQDACSNGNGNDNINRNENSPQFLQAFHSLTHLFASVDGVLVGSESSSNYSMEILVRIQHELRRYEQWPLEWNEVQRSDVSITQHWLRMLVWQLSLSNVRLSSEPGDDSMSFTYPARVSRDALRDISSVSFDALVAHGPGMQAKLCDITNTLLDVMTCVNSLTPEMFVQARHVLHEFCCYLARLNGNREGLDWSQSFMKFQSWLTRMRI